MKCYLKQPSKKENVMSTIDRVSDRLKNKINSTIYLTNEFRTYICDHKNNIIANSTKYTLNPDILARYLYRPSLFLINECSITDSDAEWIFLLINNLPHFLSFDMNLSFVYIPDTNYINSLKKTYKAIIAANINRSV